MNKHFLLALIAAGTLVVSSCNNDDCCTPEPGGQSGHYVVLTTDWGTAPDWNGSGYFRVFSEQPSGQIDNISGNATQAAAYGGFNTYKNWIFTGANPDDVTGITRYEIVDGKIANNGFIQSEDGKFVIVDDETGFYYDSGRGVRKIQQFNPTTMQRTGEIDLNIPEVLQGEANVYVGLQTLAAKEGKLYASVTYSPGGGDGFLDNTKDYTMAVVDIATGKFEKLITYAGAKNQGYPPSEYTCIVTGDDGALYFLSRYDRVGTDGEWIEDGDGIIFRIKRGETEFDANWSLKAADVGKSNAEYWPWSMTWHGDRLFIDVGTKADYDGWEVYSVDVETKQYDKISGLPILEFGHTAGNVQREADGNLYIRVESLEPQENACYVLNDDGTSVTKIFDITRGGTFRRIAYLPQ